MTGEGQILVYVGESANLIGRLSSHCGVPRGEPWSRGRRIAFVVEEALEAGYEVHFDVCTSVMMRVDDLEVEKDLSDRYMRLYVEAAEVAYQTSHAAAIADGTLVVLNVSAGLVDSKP